MSDALNFRDRSDYLKYKVEIHAGIDAALCVEAGHPDSRRLHCPLEYGKDQAAAWNWGYMSQKGGRE